MNEYFVRTGLHFDHRIRAQSFDIVDGVLYFFDDEGDIQIVIKTWIYFRCLDPEEGNVAKDTPDDYYDKLKEEE